MASGGRNDSVDGGGLSSFAHALDTLKQRGSALLVVGSVPDEMYARASAQMLGDPDATPPRRRVLVVPECDREQARERLQGTGPLSATWTRVIEYAGDARSTAASTPSAGKNGANLNFQTRTVDGTITELGTAVSDTIDEFDRITGGLEPAELRVAFDPLPVLLAEYDREAVFRFLHVLAAHIRRVRGMGHFWLPQEPDGETVTLFEPLFDAVIELRLDGGQLNQRWRFRDADIVSEWLPLEP